jgi:hypothetical protein
MGSGALILNAPGHSVNESLLLAALTEHYQSKQLVLQW